MGWRYFIKFFPHLGKRLHRHTISATVAQPLEPSIRGICEFRGRKFPGSSWGQCRREWETLCHQSGKRTPALGGWPPTSHSHAPGPQPSPHTYIQTYIYPHIYKHTHTQSNKTKQKYLRSLLLIGIGRRQDGWHPPTQGQVEYPLASS